MQWAVPGTPEEVVMARTEETPFIDVSIGGKVDAASVEHAKSKVLALIAHCREPVRSIHVRLVQEPDPARSRPAVAEATLHVDPRPIRAHIAATTMTEAVDLLVDRLDRRLDRFESRLHNLDRRHDPLDRPEGEWRHGDLPTQRPDHFDRAADEREIVRRKSFALEPMSIDEAAFDLDCLAHDFYLFTEIRTGQEAVITHGEEALELLHPEPAAVSLQAVATPITIREEAPVLTDTEARERLNAGGERFVFYRSPASGRGQVLYLRYDGHYGLIEAAYD